jgi:DNA-directed RNA polymerase specialized sigma24 family protein
VLGRLCMALLGSQADADEATQETLLRAHRGIDGSSRIADRERFLDVRRAPTIRGL